MVNRDFCLSEMKKLGSPRKPYQIEKVLLMEAYWKYEKYKYYSYNYDNLSEWISKHLDWK